MGALGEYAVAKALGLPIAYRIGTPDEGYDIVYKNVTIDVKTTTCPNPHLLIKRVEAFKADVACLCGISETRETARIWGLCSKARYWKEYEPWFVNGKGPVGYALHHSKLTPLEEFISWALKREGSQASLLNLKRSATK